MAEGKASWIDYLNVVLTVIVGLIGIGVAVLVSQSADRLSQNSLVVATASFLLDDSPKRQSAGVEIVSWLTENQVPVPSWTQRLINQVAARSNETAPTSLDRGAGIPSSPPPPSDKTATAPDRAPASTDTSQTPTEHPAQQVANNLFAVLGGATPRLFIEIANEDQRHGAEALRRAVGQIQLGGQFVVAPGVEKVSKPPRQIELRQLKSVDAPEAKTLAAALSRLLGHQVPVVDLSPTYNARSDVKGRTYELWFPDGQAIEINSSSS